MEIQIVSNSLSQFKYENPKSEKPENFFIEPTSTSIKTKTTTQINTPLGSRNSNNKGQQAGTAQVGAPVKFQKLGCLNAKETIVGISMVSQCRKIPPRQTIRKPFLPT